MNKCFVRLACVKHAASVHPEPGSNSLIKNALLSSRQLQAVDAFSSEMTIHAHDFVGAQPLPRLKKTLFTVVLLQFKITTWLSIPFTVYKDLSIVL